MPQPQRRREGGRIVLAGPPPGEEIEPELLDLAPGSELFRLYSAHPYGQTADSFRFHGPHARFDHHRAASTDPSHDPDRGILYAGESFDCALGERFGDAGAISPGGVRVARLEVRENVRLLDLRGLRARRAGTIPAIGAVGERTVTQEWARWWYEQLSGYDGLAYTSAQTAETCFALWERCEGRFAAVHDTDLDSADARADLELGARRLRLPIL